MSKINSKEKIRNMDIGDVKTFPISALETVRNNVSILNSKHFLDKYRWKSESVKEKGVVRVTRVS